MFARNLLEAGEFVTIVPLGLPITIQYSNNGAVDKVYTGHDANTWKDVTDRILTIMLMNKQIPNHVPTNGGETYVRALAYSSELQFGRGRLPECLKDKYLTAYENDPTRFKVYVGDVQSVGTAFNGAAVAVRQWLTMAHFTLLPGYVVPTDINEVTFESMVKRNFEFRWPLITSYILFHRDGTITYPSTGITMFQVESVKQIVNKEGFILGDVKERGSDDVHTVPYPQVAHNDIQKNSYVVCNSDGDIIYVYNDQNATKLLRKITCSGCGKQLFVPAANVKVFRCDDPQCNSVLYPRVNQIINTFNLPQMTFDRYEEVTKEIGPIFGVLDIFDLEEYKDIEIETTVKDVLRAIIPRDVVPGMQQIKELSEACNNEEDVVIYYLQHPGAIISDLEKDSHLYSRLIKWLGYNENISDCVEIFNIPNIKLVKAKKFVNGAPIFRDKKIYITGTFTHGNLDDIASILEGYSATVFRNFDQSVDCIVVGDIPENVNGHAVTEARRMQIPVIQESSFFAMYQIDEDIE